MGKKAAVIERKIKSAEKKIRSQETEIGIRIETGSTVMRGGEEKKRRRDSVKKKGKRKRENLNHTEKLSLEMELIQLKNRESRSWPKKMRDEAKALPKIPKIPKKE